MAAAPSMEEYTEEELEEFSQAFKVNSFNYRSNTDRQQLSL